MRTGTQRKNGMKLHLSNHLMVSEAPLQLVHELREKMTIRNPKYDDLKRMNRWTGDTPEFLRLYDHDGNRIGIPRGYISQVIDRCRKEGIPFEIIDKRRSLPPVDIRFQGTLKPFQKKALTLILKKDFGTLSSPTGSGKTVIGLAAIAERKQPALVIVHTRELLNQWIESIGKFLNVPVNQVGRIGAGSFSIGDRLTVGIVNSIYGRGKEISEHIGFVIVDECHRAPSRTFTEAVSRFDSKFSLGLSATPWRRDKLSRLIYWLVGNIVHRIEQHELIKEGHILPVNVIERETDFRTIYDPVEEYPQMLSELTLDPDRNLQICSDVAAEAQIGKGTCLVLTDRKQHCDDLRRILLNRFNTRSDLLTGDLSKADREAVVQNLNAGKTKVLVATGQLVGEGFDCNTLTTLFLATPIKFNGRLLQYIGRVMRTARGKDKAVVYDYIDRHVKVLVASAKARKRVYES